MKDLNTGTLHDALLACGFTHAPAPSVIPGPRHTLDSDGRVVFTGNWEATWAWLRATHNLGARCSHCHGPVVEVASGIYVYTNKDGFYTGLQMDHDAEVQW